MRKIRESLLFVFEEHSGLRPVQGKTSGCEFPSLIYKHFIFGMIDDL